MVTDDPAAVRSEHRRTILPAALAAVDQYDGRSDAHSWLSSFKELALIYDWNEADCLTNSKSKV